MPPEPRGRSGELHEEREAEWRECLFVERLASLVVGNREPDVIEHHSALPFFHKAGAGRVEGRAWRTRQFSRAPACGSAQQARKPAVLQYAAAGLAIRAVIDRVLLEVHLRERRATDVARLAELLVHAVGALVARATLAQLEAALKLGVDRGGEPVDLGVGQVGGERIGRELRRVQDLVCPGAPDSRE